MKAKELIEILKTKPNNKIMVACDEEWNILFKKINVEMDLNGTLVIYGVNGSEKI